MTQRERPLSPHLQVYRPQITMVMSILHRITGCVIAVGAFGIVWWLSAVAAGPEAYAEFMACATSSLSEKSSRNAGPFLSSSSRCARL